MYYIISLAHTKRHDKYLTLWRPDNKGYCFSKDMAGIYVKPTEGYHISEGNMPIDIAEAEQLFESFKIDDFEYQRISNNKSTWSFLGVRMTKYGLQRIPTVPSKAAAK